MNVKKWLKGLISPEVKAPTLKDRVNIYKDERTEESDFSYVLTAASVIFTLSLIASKIYGYNEARVQAGLIALGAVSVAFSMMGKSGSAGVVAKFFIRQLAKVFIIASLLLEVVSITGSYLSASGSRELNQQRAVKERAIQTIKDLRIDIEDIKNSSTSGNTKAYDTREIRKEIKLHRPNASMIIKGGENILFIKINKYFKIENSESLYSALLVSMLIIGGSLLWTQRNWYWSNLSLWIYILQAKRTEKLINECEVEKPAVIKSVSPEDLKESGLQGNEPEVKKTIAGNIEQAKAWVKSHKEGEKLSAKALRKATGTSSASQQNVVISELRKAGLVSKKMNGKVPNYFKAEPKKAALEQIKETGNLIKLFKK